MSNRVMFGSDFSANNIPFGFGIDLAAVQTKLNTLGANPQLTVDGVNGPKTIAAVKAFQNAKGLTADGIVGPMTLAALGLTDTPPAEPTSSNLPPGEVPNKMTPLTAAQAAKAISDGYSLVTGSKPNPVILALLLGQSALETGNWNSIHNYNFGNKKATSGDRNWQFFRCSEIINGKEVFFDPPAPECKFSAYGSAAEGAAAYIRTLKNRPHWWDGLHSGTVSGFINGLTTKPAYFTANPTVYAKTLSDRMNNYASLAKQYASNPIVASSSLLAIGVGVLAGLFLVKRTK